MKLVAIIGIGLLFPDLAFSKQVNLRLQFSQFGKPVCQGEKQLESGESFLFCEGKARNNRVLVKIKAEPLPRTAEQEADRNFRQQVQISATVEKIAPSGKILIVSSPQIIALDGEPAEISESESQKGGEELFRLSLLPSLTD